MITPKPESEGVRESVGGLIAKPPGPEDVATPPLYVPPQPPGGKGTLITHELAYGTSYRLQTPIQCF